MQSAIYFEQRAHEADVAPLQAPGDMLFGFMLRRGSPSTVFGCDITPIGSLRKTHRHALPTFP